MFSPISMHTCVYAVCVVTVEGAGGKVVGSMTLYVGDLALYEWGFSVGLNINNLPVTSFVICISISKFDIE